MMIDELPRYISLGNQGEKGVTVLTFDISAWRETRPSVICGITMQRDGEEEPFPVSGVTQTDDILTWAVGNDATQYSGAGTIVIRGIEGTTEKRSVMTAVIVAAGHAEAGAAPEEVSDWLSEQIAADAERAVAVENAVTAAMSAAGTANTAAENADDAAANANASAEAADSAAANALDVPRLNLSFLGAPLGYRMTGATYIVTPCAMYHVYANRYKTTGALYILENAFTGGTSQRVYRSLDGGRSWTLVATIPVNITGGERLTKIFVEPVYETLYFLKTVNVTSDAGHYNVVSYTNAAVLQGTLDIGYHQWLNSSRSIDSTYDGANTVVMFGEYGGDDQATMKVWKTTDKGATWTAVLTKTGNNGNGTSGEVRHFHTCQVDPYTGYWWLSSGDADAQCFIWMSTDSGATWTLLDGGVSQETRLIGFVFESAYLYYGMDTANGEASSYTTQIFKCLKSDITQKTALGTQPENTSIRGMIRTFFPNGFLVLPARESTSRDVGAVTPQFFSYETETLYNLKPFNLLGKAEGGFFDASRYQCKWSGMIAAELYGDLATSYAYDQFADTTDGSKLVAVKLS